MQSRHRDRYGAPIFGHSPIQKELGASVPGAEGQLVSNHPDHLQWCRPTSWNRSAALVETFFPYRYRPSRKSALRRSRITRGTLQRPQPGRERADGQVARERRIEIPAGRGIESAGLRDWINTKLTLRPEVNVWKLYYRLHDPVLMYCI